MEIMGYSHKHVEGSLFGNKCSKWAIVFFVIGAAYLFKDTRVGLVLILIAIVLFFIGMMHDYKKVSKGELYWEREPESFKGELVNCPHCSEKVSATEKFCPKCEHEIIS